MAAVPPCIKKKKKERKVDKKARNTSKIEGKRPNMIHDTGVKSILFLLFHMKFGLENPTEKKLPNIFSLR